MVQSLLCKEHQALTRANVVGLMANSRVTPVQGLPLSYCVVPEYIPGMTRMDPFSPRCVVGNREEEVMGRLVAHYKKAEAKSE